MLFSYFLVNLIELNLAKYSIATSSDKMFCKNIYDFGRPIKQHVACSFMSVLLILTFVHSRFSLQRVLTWFRTSMKEM